MKSSFNGEIVEIPGIAVDNFSKQEGIRAYFLSHCHADHIVGLNTLTGLSETVFIYMSDISAAIVESHVNKHLNKYIKPLKLETTTVTIPGDENADIPETYVEVTLIPAGHCFGSVMFLFETPLKKVLYTGDFRISMNSVSKMAQLHRNSISGTGLVPIKLDTLYVDNTFQEEKYEYFPKRSEVLDGVVREIQSWFNQGVQYHIGITPSARYGYEDVCNKLYKRIGIKVYVDSNWTLYSKFLNRLPGVTCNSHETRIHLCSRDKKFCNLCRSNTDYKYLYFKLSALGWKNQSPEDMIQVRKDNVVRVCYSTHCSRSELMFFIEYLSPKNVVGFPHSYTPVKKAPEVAACKRKSPRSLEKDPNNGKPKKVPKHVLKKLFE